MRGPSFRPVTLQTVALGLALSVLAGCAPGALTAFGSGAPDAAGTRQDRMRYVALGDSFTSGPLLPHITGNPIDCGRSLVNYPSLVARDLAVDEFADASCGSAKTAHMENEQKAPLGSRVRPQFDALTTDSDIVTVGIGGNDVSFSSSVLGCVNLLPVPIGKAPWGGPCVDKRVVDGVDRMSVRIGETRELVDDVLAGIALRSPDARVFVIGYPVSLPHVGDGCWPRVPILPVDVHYLRDKYLEMNQMLADAAVAAGATYVDVYTPSIGHDVCQPYGVAWINSINIDPAGLPLHPNHLSHRATADVVAAAIRAELGS